MACWSRDDKTVHGKVVYYGPACGGKTTNLETLHRVADARRGHELLTVQTQKDSTLFFDLLPFDLDDVLGHRVEVKLYTVPGLVRLDATRKVVLSGADVIVFVADSRSSQREKNIWSLQNLRMNMRAKDVDPERVPILFQINKRDATDAAPAAEVAEWLGVEDEQVIPAVATRGEGVLETFKAACREFLSRPADPADGGPDRPLDPDELAEALDRALAPYADRLSGSWLDGSSAERPKRPIVLNGGDPLENAIETSVRLGEERTAEASRARRLSLEADGFRRLGESLCEIGAGTQRSQAIEAALEIARDVLEARSVTSIAESPAGPLVQEGGVGCPEDPLLGFASGRSLLRRLMSADGPCVIDDLAEHCAGMEGSKVLGDLRSAAAVQVPHEGPRILVAYAARPGGMFEQEDVRFLRSVARHLAAGLDKTRAHEEAARHRDRLEKTATPVDRDRRRARGPRRAVDRIRERFLGSLASEMRAPVAAVATAAVALRDCKIKTDERTRLASGIVNSTDLLERQLDDLARLIHVTDEEPLQVTEVAPRKLVKEALRIAGHSDVSTKVERGCPAARFDLEGLARAVANLIDNAVKFSPSGGAVHVDLSPDRIETERGDVDALTVSVLDRGPGVRDEDRERIFAPFAPATAEHEGASHGMGIGLYEARCLVRRHGGTLVYEPREGGGSEFRLSVPLAPVAEAAPMEVSRG